MHGNFDAADRFACNGNFTSQYTIASETIDSPATSAESAGAAIGKGIGAALLLFIWVAGAVILGLLTLLTRPKK